MAVSGSAWDMVSRKYTAYSHSHVRFSVSARSARVSHEPPRVRLWPSRPEAASTAPDGWPTPRPSPRGSTAGAGPAAGPPRPRPGWGRATSSSRWRSGGGAVNAPPTATRAYGSDDGGGGHCGRKKFLEWRPAPLPMKMLAALSLQLCFYRM